MTTLGTHVCKSRTCCRRTGLLLTVGEEPAQSADRREAMHADSCVEIQFVDSSCSQTNQRAQWYRRSGPLTWHTRIKMVMGQLETGGMEALSAAGDWLTLPRSPLPSAGPQLNLRTSTVQLLRAQVTSNNTNRPPPPDPNTRHRGCPQNGRTGTRESGPTRRGSATPRRRSTRRRATRR